LEESENRERRTQREKRVKFIFIMAEGERVELFVCLFVCLFVYLQERERFICKSERGLSARARKKRIEPNEENSQKRLRRMEVKERPRKCHNQAIKQTKKKKKKKN